MERLRNDGAFDIRMLTRKINIRNIKNRDLVYFISEIKTGTNNIKSIKIGDNTYHENINNELRKPHQIPAGKSLKIEIMYDSDATCNNITTDKTKLSIWVWRILSDFRDIILSKNDVGRAIIRIYKNLFNIS
jgi:hypothetical protein